MSNKDEQLTQATAAADRQRALARDTLDRTIKEARDMLAQGEGPTIVWAVLGYKMVREMGVHVEVSAVRRGDADGVSGTDRSMS